MRSALRSKLALATVPALAALAACSDTQPTAPFDGDIEPLFTHSRTPDAGHVAVCQDGPAGSYGVGITVVTGTGDLPLGNSFNMPPGCVTVYTVQQPASPEGDPLSELIISQTGLPAGISLTEIEVHELGDNPYTLVGVTSADVVMNYFHGAVVTFRYAEEPPPPPPAGGQGCTPGYWKNHDGWPSPYTPDQLFSSVFEDAFPDKTLQDVLKQGGGGLKALGRHTVAGLLNSADMDVAYGMNPADVIAAFNAVFPDGDFETQKNEFEALNESGCPL